jgi:hypothetical protein
MTPVYPTSVKFEMLLTVPLTDEDGNILTDENGTILGAEGWVDVSADVIPPFASWTRGNNGNTVIDRIANTGTMSFTLNNSQYNEAETAGYYSPDHTDVATRFGMDTSVRLTITENSVVHEEWQGKICKIAPDFGVYGNQATRISCEDWMANAYRDKIRGITVQTNKRDDEILNTLLLLAAEPPLDTDFSTGDDTYTYSLHDENSQKSTLARVFQKLAMSGFGRIYLEGYGTLVYRSRSDLLLSGTPAASFDNSVQDLKVSRNKRNRIKDIFVTTFPVEISSTIVLWQAQRELELAAGETKEFDISFRDPSGRSTRVSAVSLETPVADTDFKFSSVSGSGNDLNASLGITVELKADIATVTVTNNAGGIGYLYGHQQRGVAALLYEPVTIPSSTGQSDGETLDIEMVYQDDQFVGSDISNLLTSWFTVDQSDVDGLKFIANISQDLMDAAFLPLGSLIYLRDTQTGINTNFIINGTAKRFLAPDVIEVTYYVVQANQLSGVCVLDLVGSAELDSTAYLAA